MAGVFDSLPADGSAIATEEIFAKADAEPALVSELLWGYVAWAHAATDDHGKTFRRLTAVES